MATVRDPEVVDLVGQDGDRGGVGGTATTGVGNGMRATANATATSGVQVGVGINGSLGIIVGPEVGAGISGSAPGRVAGMRPGVATPTGDGMRSGATVGTGTGIGNATTYGAGVPVGTGSSSGMGLAAGNGFGGGTQSRFGGATGMPGGNATGVGGVSASGAGVRMQVGVSGTNGAGTTGGGNRAGYGGLFAELRGFDLRCFSTSGGPLPEATKQVRQQYRDLGNMLHDMTERKLEYFEARVNQQHAMLQRYEQQLQTERNDSQRQRTEYEQTANEKLQALQKLLDDDTKVTGNLKTEIETLRASERFHRNLTQNQSIIIADRERKIDGMRNEQDLMESAKKAAEKKVKELLAENARLKLKLGQPVSSDGQMADSSSPPEAPQKRKMTNEDERGAPVASGSYGRRKTRTGRITRCNAIGMQRPRGSSHRK